jgi:hypothetical protein
MFPLNTIIAWNINIIMNKKYGNNNIIIASRAYFLHTLPVSADVCLDSEAEARRINAHLRAAHTHANSVADSFWAD